MFAKQQSTPVDFKNLQWDLLRVKEYASGMIHLNRNPRLHISPTAGKIGYAAKLAVSMAFNLGFQTKCILEPLMHALSTRKGPVEIFFNSI